MGSPTPNNHMQAHDKTSQTKTCKEHLTHLHHYHHYIHNIKIHHTLHITHPHIKIPHITHLPFHSIPHMLLHQAIPKTICPHKLGRSNNKSKTSRRGRQRNHMHNGTCVHTPLIETLQWYHSHQDSRSLRLTNIKGREIPKIISNNFTQHVWKLRKMTLIWCSFSRIVWEAQR